jgi:hypothetical protein
LQITSGSPWFRDSELTNVRIAGYFFFWVILSMIWGIVATFVATFMPIIESRDTLKNIFVHMCGGGRGSKNHAAPESDTSDPPLKVVDMPQLAGDDTAHHGAKKFVV